MSRPEDQIVFEDLHGVNKDDAVTIDLDAGAKDDGITRSPADEAAGAGGKKDDDIKIDALRSADDDDHASSVADKKDDDKDDAIKPSEDDEYSKKVKARIDREQRAKRKERKRADHFENEAKRLAKEAHDRDKQAAEKIIEQTTSDIEQVSTDLEQAIEDGKTKDQVRLTSRLSDLKADKVRAEVGLENLPADGNVQPFDGRVTSPSDKRSQADDWMDDRSDWYGARGFERQTRLANRIDKEVFGDNYDPNTPEYFEELDRRMKEKEPSLYESLDKPDDDQTDKDDKDKRPSRSPVAAVSGHQGRRQSSSSSKVELGEADFANMRRFNLDPNDPEVLKEYARNKREAELGEKS